MTLRELQVYAGCPKKYEIERLAIGEQMRYGYWETAIRQMCSMLERMESISKIKGWIFFFFREKYRKSWFQLPWQKEEAVRQDVAYFSRYLDTVRYEELLEIQSNKRIAIEAGRVLGGKYIDNILLHVHLQFKRKNGTIEAVMFRRRFARRYSYQAMLWEHSIQSAPELAAMQYAFREIPDTVVTMVQLASEDDRPECLEIFEKRPGANKISLRAGENDISTEALQERIFRGIEAGGKEDCKKCRQESLCRVAAKIRYEPEKTVTMAEVQYSEEQLAVIGCMKGRIRVSAGPGSGKTAVIAARVKAMITAGIPVEQILVLSYTREAARELAARMQSVKNLQVGTLHAFAYQMLLEYHAIVGKKKLASLLEKKMILLQVLKHAPRLSGMSYDGMQTRYGLLQTLLDYFDYIDQYGEAKFCQVYWKKDVEGILRIKSFYDAVIKAAGYISYDGQIREAVKLLAENPAVLRKEQQKHPYILIDEAQDLDVEQANLLQLLTGSIGNLMIVGDDDQAIFGFRGGSNAFMLQFLEIYPDAQDMVLGKNYRSSEEIIQVANALIGNNQNRIPKRMISHKGVSGFPCVHLERFDRQKLPAMLSEIRNKLGCEWRDIAVIAKNNKELNALCDILEIYNQEKDRVVDIPYDRPKYYLREDAVFCGIYDLCSLAVKGMDEDSHLFRLARNLGTERIGKEDKSKSLYRDLLARGLIYSFEEEDLCYYEVTEKDPEHLRCFAKICKARAALSLPNINTALRLAAEILFAEESLDYEPVLESMEELIQEKGIRRIEELQKLLEMMWFLGNDARIHYSRGRNKVRFLTAHDAKGQEFQTVFIYGIDLFESGNEEEDRRLLYVAMTRAERFLVTSEMVRGKSNFLREYIDYVKVWR